MSSSQTAPGNPNRQTGFTLIEFLIASFILLVVASVVFKLLSEIQRAASYQAEVQSVLNNTRIAMQTVERYVRQAGNDPLESGLSGITIVDATEVQIRSDRTGSSGAGKGDPDGDIDDPNENITIRYNKKTQSLEIVPHGGPAQIVTNHISDLSMQYFNSEGEETTLGNEVRRIVITISGSAQQPDPDTHRVFGVKLSESIRVLT
jgi:prepilin-type N-terminal cleavage/methylation domain-containing protein